MITRRSFLRYTAAIGGATCLSRVLPGYATPSLISIDGPKAGKRTIDLRIGEEAIRIGNRTVRTTTVNGTVPGPLLRFHEGETVTLRVINELKDDTSIHWHGILLPYDMDGVPQVSFAGIQPGETFTYKYPVKQSGTYWYHSHSGFQEQTGIYGPIIIDPIEPEPFEFDRDYVVMFSDWTFDDPADIVANLKKMGGYYNFQRRTVGDFFSDVADQGLGATLSDRLRWGRMRMDPTDISDVTGATYRFLTNGMAPEDNWTGMFRPSERVRLRFINAGATTFFDVSIPGLQMTVVQVDGQNVQPIGVDEIRIAVAETYDVIVQPTEDRAYTIFAEAMDRSGFARGTLATRPGMIGPIPERRTRPVRTMADMGMDMTGMDVPETDMPGMDMPGMGDQVEASGPPWGPTRHGPDHHGRAISMVAMVSRSRLHEPGVGLEDAGHRVLVYSDLRSLTPGQDQREPEREIELHLTGNMERYMWSFDGKKYSQAREPIRFGHGERLRLTFVNDTMMDHPIHLHGMWMELENGAGMDRPRKHTVNVKPAERVSVLVTADEVGRWALHCHILYHMETGMFRVVEVVGRAAPE